MKLSAVQPLGNMPNIIHDLVQAFWYSTILISMIDPKLHEVMRKLEAYRLELNLYDQVS